MSDYWTKYWQQGHLTSFGQDFTGNYIGVLKKVWDTFFSEIADNASILDIGTGNGAILDLALQNNSSFDLVGIDSAELTIPKKLGNIHNLQFLQNVKAEELPFDTEHFSAVVSQFGIEYANFSKALPELIRVLQANGQIQLVMHDLNSSIVKPNKQILKAALALSTSDGPVVHARRLVNALSKKGRNSVEAETCRQNLNLSISTITNINHVGLIGTNFPDFLKYLMSGDVDFAAKKKSIKLFEQELKGQIVRLSDLTNAALSNTKYKLCIDTLQKLGISIEQDYILIEDNMTIARVIRGRKN